MSETRSILKFTVYLLMAIAVALICALATSLCSCSADKGNTEEHPPAPLQSTTYDMEIDGETWTATKVYDTTTGGSWWMLHKEYTGKYVVLEGASNVPVG